MRILKVSEYYFGLNGILVLSTGRSASIKAFFRNAFAVLFMGPFVCGLSAAYIYLNPDEAEKCVKSFSIICGAFLVAGKSFTLKLNGKKLKSLIEIFQETVDKGLLFTRFNDII